VTLWMNKYGILQFIGKNVGYYIQKNIMLL
jgi:hypothetical protein